MNLIRQTRDFIFGVLAIGVTPVIVYLGMFLLWLGAAYIFRDSVLALSAATSVIAPILAVLALLLAIRWRKTHRLLPASTFPAEVILGVILGVVSFIVLVALWRGALRD